MQEALSPDDYWGYAALRNNVPKGMLVTTGEHEATRWGFRMLLEIGLLRHYPAGCTAGAAASPSW